MVLLIVASLGFLAIHLFPALPQRTAVVNRLGENAYLGLYSVLSLAFISLMAFAYAGYLPEDMLWGSGIALRQVTALLMLVPFFLLVLGVTAPNPASAGQGGILEKDATPKGGFTVTRHPLMNGIAIWALLHLINNPDPGSLVFFGTFFVTAVWGMVLQDRRKEREIGSAWRHFQAHSSILPFVAALQKRTTIDWRGIGWWRPVLALVLWAAILHFHEAVFSVPALF